MQSDEYAAATPAVASAPAPLNRSVSGPVSIRPSQAKVEATTPSLGITGEFLQSIVAGSEAKQREVLRPEVEELIPAIVTALRATAAERKHSHTMNLNNDKYNDEVIAKRVIEILDSHFLGVDISTHHKAAGRTFTFQW